MLDMAQKAALLLHLKQNESAIAARIAVRMQSKNRQWCISHGRRYVCLMKSLVRNNFRAIDCEATFTLRGFNSFHLRIMLWKAALDCGIKLILVPGLHSTLYETTNAYEKKIVQNNRNYADGCSAIKIAQEAV